MATSLMEDAFAHHIWATLELIDACAPLSDDQLATPVPGTYGSIVETMRHTVGSDRSYLLSLGEELEPFDRDAADLSALRAAMEAQGVAWLRLLTEDTDADRVIVRRHDDGWVTHATVGIRLAQAIHHGTDHRSQICTALTSLGIEPPEIDVWAFGEGVGRVVDEPPAG